MVISRQSIHRSWPRTLGFVIAAIAVGTAGAAGVVLLYSVVTGLAETGLYSAFLIGLMVLCAASVLYGVFALLRCAVSRSSCSACPRCGERIAALSSGRNDGVRCEKCLRYLEGTDGLLWETADDRIAAEAIFEAALPNSPVMPSGCCVCGKPAVRHEKMRVINDQRTGAAGIAVEVPHCAEHHYGACLRRGRDGPLIAFRSYRYQKAFREANGV